MSAIIRVGRNVEEAVRPRLRSATRKVFPGHGSFLLGEITLFAFLTLVVTGVYLALFYDASAETVVYDGPHQPLAGVPVSSAYASVLDITFDRTGGVVMRQTHHWSAVVFVAAMTLHLLRVFFTGAFRRPRRLNWVIGVTLLVLSMGAGFFGLALPYDLLGGTGARIGHAELLSVPLIGPGLVDLLYAGEFGNAGMLRRFWWLHVFILPGLIGLLLAVHLALVWFQTHTQFPGPGRRDDNVVGDRSWPVYAAKSVSMALVTFGTLLVAGATLQIAPVWLYGPFRGAASTVPAQPDWYLGWIEGMLRIVPGTGMIIGRWEIPNPFFVGILLPSAFIVALYVWPFAEARLTGDHEPHHLLDRPRDRPVRTALGVAGLTALTVFTLAGSHDLAALLVRVPIDDVTTFYRWLLVVATPASGFIAYRVCRGLVRSERDELGRYDLRRLDRSEDDP